MCRGRHISGDDPRDLSRDMPRITEIKPPAAVLKDDVLSDRAMYGEVPSKTVLPLPIRFPLMSREPPTTTPR